MPNMRISGNALYIGNDYGIFAYNLLRRLQLRHGDGKTYFGIII